MALDPAFDSLPFAELLASLLSLVGFLLATFSALAGKELKQFLSEIVVQGISWLLIALPSGLMLAGMLTIGASSGPKVLVTGIAMFTCMLPTNLMIEWAARHQLADARLNWAAATLVLLGALVQVSISLSRFPN